MMSISSLSGSTMTLKTAVDTYSSSTDTKTNTDFKNRVEVVSVREANQADKINQLLGETRDVLTNKIPELQRRDAEN